MGKVCLGLFSVAMFVLSCVMMTLYFSAMSAHFAYASSKTVPIPPRRPDVLSASPAYIKHLMEQNRHISDTDNFSDNSEDEYILVSEDDYVSLQNVDSQTLLPMLSDEPEQISVAPKPAQKIAKQDIPIPEHKPNYSSNSVAQRIEDFSDNPSSVKMSEIAPATGETTIDRSDVAKSELENQKDIDAVRQPITSSKTTGNETALVSFTLEPEQVSLDTAMKNFLLEHAVKMFKDDPGLRMEIHAYASVEEGQTYSDVRRSLARALEVRSFLLEQNIDPSRLKLTPLGQDNNNTTDNRIDLLFIASRR